MNNLDCNESIFVDPPCEKLAVYLRDRINSAYPEQTVIQSTRNFDDFNVPFQDYPVLKVYRLSDSGQFNQNQIETQAAISYGLVLPDLDKLCPLLAWVRKQIQFYLSAYNVNCAGESPMLGRSFRAEYRTMFNELNQRVYMFLRISFTFKDF